MLEFIRAAFPWVLLGLLIAVSCAGIAGKKK